MSLKCHKKSVLLHQVRACNQFVQPTCFNGKGMCVSVCKVRETGTGLNSAELRSSTWRILWDTPPHTQCNLYSTRIFHLFVCLSIFFPYFRAVKAKDFILQYRKYVLVWFCLCLITVTTACESTKWCIVSV